MRGDGLPLPRELLARVLLPLADASPLPPAAYLDPDVLAWELEHFFEQAWVCVARVEDLPPESLTLATVGRESLLVCRDLDGTLRSFFNVCQHRGTRLVQEPCLEGVEVVVCPYHSWTYGLDGRLRAAERMPRDGSFDRSAMGLVPVATESMGGWVFVNVSGTAVQLQEYLGDLPAHLEAHDPASLVRTARAEYEVAANWKLLSENYQECYHCPSIHPELTTVTAVRSGRYDDSAGPWMGGPMDLMPGCTTMSLTGTSERSALPLLPDGARSRVWYYSLLPNLWISLHPDYVLTHSVWPLEPGRTRIVCDWLFHPNNVEGEGGRDAVEFWDLVNRQDWQACERVQLGVGSKGFRGGRFSPDEEGVHKLSKMLAASYLAGRIVPAGEVDAWDDGGQEP